MADDNIPVKDTNNNAYRSSGASAMDIKAAQQRRQMTKWDRDELEDKYLRIHEECLLLKKHARKQEDKIKRMATKLLRLVNDKKKQDVEGKSSGASLAAEEKIMELEDKMLALEKQNTQLKDKLALLKQQALAGGSGKRVAPYPYVQSRIDTRIPKQQSIQIDPRVTRNLRVMGPMQPETTKRVVSPPLQQQRFGHGVTEESRVERRILEDNVAQLTEQCNLYEYEIAQLQEQNKLREAEFEEELIKFKTQATTEQRQSVQENIDLIKLQRDVKEKSARLIALQEKYGALEENTHVLRHNHDQILVEMERLNVQLKEEQSRVLLLQNQMKMSETQQRRMTELQEQVVDLQREADTLKEANEKLVGSAFDLEREREWRQRENKLKVQVAQLEATLKSDLGEKGSIIDRYANERDSHEKLQQEYRELQINHFQVKEELDDIKEKLNFFTKESSVDLTELEDALVLVKQKKQKSLPDPEFLHKIDEELNKDHKQQVLQLQADYAETVHELEKTRNMLVVQHKINKDYHKQSEVSNQTLEETKKEYELKLDEYARLLDIRAGRIKKLEAQLRDVAYGTRQYRIAPPDEDVESSMDLEETLQLERGQNLFEIHIHKINLSEDAVRHIGDEEPSLFCTWDFFEFESQSTPVIRGSRPMFDFTSQYIVKVDDFFLHYLQKKTGTLELHQTFGQEFRTVAACQLVFRDLFDKPSGRIHGIATLTGVAEGDSGVGYGTVEYWIRLRVPMDQALRLYKERTKALGYLTANEQQMKEAVHALDEEAARRPMDNVNELHVKINKCSKLKARRKDVQPSPYCVYQFFNFSDHDTVIVTNTNNPEFHDHKSYPVPMTPDLDQYLRTVQFTIFIFDDADPEEASYIGKAVVPLLPLVNVHEGSLKGTFPLVHRTPDNAADPQPDRTQSLGTIDVEIYWQYPYVRPAKAKASPLQMDPAPQDDPERLAASAGSHGPPRPSLKRPSHPSAHSTPMLREKAATSRESLDPPEQSLSSPKPVARRRVRMTDSLESPGEDAVHNAVTQVVTGFMPTSQSMSSLADMSTIRSERDMEEAAGEPSPVQKEAPPGPVVSEGEPSSEEEELRARPTPPRSSLNIEPGSASEQEEKSSRRLKHLPSSQRRPPSLEDDEEEIAEEVQEEVDDESSTPREEGEKSSTPTPTPPLQAQTTASEAAKVSETESEPPMIESDSEGVAMVALMPKRKSRLKPSDQVTVVVSHLSLNEDSPVMRNAAVKRLFVEYRFLGVPADETETPDSLPKPRPHHSIAYNFSKTIAVDMDRHYEQRQHLAAMLLPDDPDGGRIKFTIVSEPDGEDEECVDVGVAYASVRDILKNQKDVKDQDLDILQTPEEQDVIGQLNVTVECLAALRAVDMEMQVEGTY